MSIAGFLQAKGIFNTWMLEHQDLVQSSSKSYGEKLLCDTFLEAIARVDKSDQDLHQILTRLFKVSYQ